MSIGRVTEILRTAWWINTERRYHRSDPAERKASYQIVLYCKIYPRWERELDCQTLLRWNQSRRKDYLGVFISIHRWEAAIL